MFKYKIVPIETEEPASAITSLDFHILPLYGGVDFSDFMFWKIAPFYTESEMFNFLEDSERESVPVDTSLLLHYHLTY